MSSQTSSQNDENFPRESSHDSIESIDSVEKEEDAPKRMVPLSKREIKDENEIKAWFSLLLITMTRHLWVISYESHYMSQQRNQTKAVSNLVVNLPNICEKWAEKHGQELVGQAKGLAKLTQAIVEV